MRSAGELKGRFPLAATFARADRWPFATSVNSGLGR